MHWEVAPWYQGAIDDYGHQLLKDFVTNYPQVMKYALTDLMEREPFNNYAC